MSDEFKIPPKWVRCDACMRNRGKAQTVIDGKWTPIDCPVCKGTGWEKVKQ